MAVSLLVQGVYKRDMSSLQWGPGHSETFGCPSPSISGPWEASSEVSVREGNNGGGLLQVSKLTPCPQSFAPEAIHTPHSCWRCPGGSVHKAYAPLGNQWCWGRRFYCPPHNTLPCVGVVGQNWRPSNIVQSLEPFKWSVTWSL